MLLLGRDVLHAECERIHVCCTCEVVDDLLESEERLRIFYNPARSGPVLK